MGKRKELLALKQRYWEAEDYKSVKKVRIAIKEYDRLHPQPQKEYRKLKWSEVGPNPA